MRRRDEKSRVTGLHLSFDTASEGEREREREREKKGECEERRKEDRERM